MSLFFTARLYTKEKEIHRLLAFRLNPQGPLCRALRRILQAGGPGREEVAPKHAPAARAHPAHTLVVASADHPLGGQAEDDGRHSVLMGCGEQGEGQRPSGQDTSPL